MRSKARVGFVAAAIVAGVAAVASVFVAVWGAAFVAAALFALSGGATLVSARLYAASATDRGGPGDAASPGSSPAPGSTEMTADELLRAKLAGTYGLSGQLHSARIVCPPMLLLIALSMLLREGLVLASALSVAPGLYLTRLGWLAGLKFDRVAPKTPNLRRLEAGRPWVDLAVLVLASALLVLLFTGAFSDGMRSEAVIIGAMAAAAVIGVGFAARRIFRRHRAER